MHPTRSYQRVGSPDMRSVRGATTKAYSLEYVEEEQRRNGPCLGFPEGAGRFWAATASLVAHVPLRVHIASRSLSRSKIVSANALRTPGRVH